MKSLTAMIAVVGCVTTAQAGFTEISSPEARGDLGHAEILGSIYGGSFTADGVNFTSGDITAVRMHDFDSGDGHSGVMNLTTSSGDGMNDQVWQDGVALMGARARYGGTSQSFGIYQGDDDPATGFTGDPLLSISANPFLGTGATYGQTTLSGDWRWGLDNTALQSSMESENAGGIDHMVTYMITGDGLAALGYDPGATVWLLFWDSATTESASRDFNDFVVEVSAAVAIPLPAPVALAGVGLCGILLARKRFARRLA